MKEIKTILQEKTDTLETDVKKFANALPYWSKYLAEKLLSGEEISDEMINNSYSYLEEQLQLKPNTEKPEIIINYNPKTTNTFTEDLILKSIVNVEGVNALAEKQKLDFSNALTIIYGINGSGKSGYTRLLKDVFYSKSAEKILPNIHSDEDMKEITAEFVFSSNSKDTTLTYADKHQPNFKQFSVFDGKCVIRQLDSKNEFEFRPAGLSFFNDFSNTIQKVKQKHDIKTSSKKSINIGETLLDGDSEIKTFVLSISGTTKIEDLEKYTPFSSEDEDAKKTAITNYDNLKISLANKVQEIKSIQDIKTLLTANKKGIEQLNKSFSKDSLNKVLDTISKLKSVASIAKLEGIEKFTTENIQNVGSDEWKNFIISAKEFSKNQKSEDLEYPQPKDNCLLCQQPLSNNAKQLIEGLWKFIKSKAEQDLKNEQEKLEKVVTYYEKLNFDLFPIDNILTNWFLEKYPKEISELQKNLEIQKALREEILKSLKNNTIQDYKEVEINTEHHIIILESIENTLRELTDEQQDKRLKDHLAAKILLEHKEKFNLHFNKFKEFWEEKVWLDKAEKEKFSTRNITMKEKELSGKYFNQKYIDLFNQECKDLNGNFGIEINHTGTDAKSFRQLKLKGNSPYMVLSEGEQKVIAIADFITEMKLSGINRGILFDDPVTSLDETRKGEIASRLVKEAKDKQVIIFTHDLVFVSSLIEHAKTSELHHDCHWIENQNGKPGTIWLNNAPSYETKYRNNTLPTESHKTANKQDCAPEIREYHLKSGFAQLRTCYEVLVIHELFCNVVQRFNERVSIDSLNSVHFTKELVDELMDSFGQCCRYMEGHTHSDKYAYKKPSVQDLQAEILRYDQIRKKIKDQKKLVA